MFYKTSIVALHLQLANCALREKQEENLVSNLPGKIRIEIAWVVQTLLRNRNNVLFQLNANLEVVEICITRSQLHFRSDLFPFQLLESRAI